jgi:hypothetical protein
LTIKDGAALLHTNGRIGGHADKITLIPNCSAKKTRYTSIPGSVEEAIVYASKMMLYN